MVLISYYSVGIYWSCLGVISFGPVGGVENEDIQFGYILEGYILFITVLHADFIFCGFIFCSIQFLPFAKFGKKRFQLRK